MTAKTFAETGQFRVTVFEKKARIGGIWALGRSTQGAFLSPDTPTNLSRFTVGFADLDWASVDLHRGQENGGHSKDGPRAPMFPKAWMVNEYLETYARRYIPEGTIRCKTGVTNAERKGDQWNITVREDNGHSETLTFEYLIMASGFFAQPRDLRHSVPHLPKSYPHMPVPTLHTSAFRSLDRLFPDPQPAQGRTILMLGGGNSSGETAANIALQMSDTQWSPDRSKAQRYQGFKIVHITPRPLYPVPPFIEYQDHSKSYVPLDFRLYDFARRPESLPSYGGRQTMDVRNIVHQTLQNMMGGDLSDISPALVSHSGDGRGSVYVALSESYAEYVRSGTIDVVAGRVNEIRLGEDGSTASVVVQQGDEKLIINDIAAIVHATGYTPHPALDILDDATKAAIKYDPDSMRLPMILEQWQTMNRDSPTLAFIGFYEGPYWPVMELQARLAAQRWTSGKSPATKPYEQQEELLKLRASMRDRSLDVPQYWLGDHLGYMEDMAKELGLQRRSKDFKEREGMPSPARYRTPFTNTAEADAIMADLSQEWNACTHHTKYVARAAFRALQGNWTIKRHFASSTPTFPSGTLEGTASFHPRHPTSNENNSHPFDFEYLYTEAGTFTLATSDATMTAKRRYVYRYREATDTLSVWFVKPDRELLEVDYLFHDLAFESSEAMRREGALVAKADHPCGRDMYWTEYRLAMQGVALREWRLTHTVKGPNKDYVATTVYTRPGR